MVYYSALHWAKKAEKSAENVQNITQEIENSKNDGLSAINSAKDEAINDILLQTNTFSRNIGEIVQSSIPLTDAGLHLLDGSIIFGDGIYADFVNYIKNLTNNYPNLFISEEAWQNYVTSYGVCGKFVYDSTNNTVRLPKITGFVEGTVDSNALGELIEAGLPNITGNIWAGGNYGSSIFTTSTGAFQNGSNSDWRATTTQTTVSGASDTVIFDASRSSSIYGNSNTVQPQAIKVFYYIVVATLTKTDIEINTDNIITELNNKINNQDAVHKTGNETIKGYKIFSDGIFVPEQSSTGTPISNVFVEKDGVANYLKMGNGIIIQWGATTTNSTVTFPVPFANTNYRMSTTQHGHTENTNNISIENHTTTSIYIRKNGVNVTFDWIAIGRWN